MGAESPKIGEIFMICGENRNIKWGGKRKEKEYRKGS